MQDIRRLKRTLNSDLLLWKDQPNRRPLLLRGARQVGKTWIARQLGQAFSHFVEINLEARPEFHPVFKDFFGKPNELISALSLMTGLRIVPGETLLFLDEIQSCKEALLALRYFREELPELHVISAGSLLEFTISELSFPVGRIDFIHVFPMTFKEFLQAQGHNDWVETIDQSSPTRPLPSAIHELLLNEISLYFMIGGMPEVVKTYIETKDLTACQEVQQELIATYREDFHKYASRAQIEHIRRVFDAVPRWLGQKFKYSNVSKETRSRELSNALALLEDAGIIYRVCHTSANGLPLSAEEDRSKFKTYFVDIGLCQRILGLPLAQLFLERKDLISNRGPMAEQFVAQELLAQTPPNTRPTLHYWHREARSAQAEIDFVIQTKQGTILPIEVKSAQHGQMKSLHQFLKEKNLPKGLKISTFPFSSTETIDTLPFYAVASTATATPHGSTTVRQIK